MTKNNNPPIKAGNKINNRLIFNWHPFYENESMFTAKIIRHRHKYLHYMNDDLKSVREDTHFKIVFSAPEELEKFEKWCVDNKGKYEYDKNNSCQVGKFPTVEIFKEEICWCDLMTYYLLHVAGYSYHSALAPYKGEVYIKEENQKAL